MLQLIFELEDAVVLGFEDGVVVGADLGELALGGGDASGDLLAEDGFAGLDGAGGDGGFGDGVVELGLELLAFLLFVVSRDVEGLGALAAVAVDGYRLDALSPGLHVGFCDVVDGAVVGEVDRL